MFRWLRDTWRGSPTVEFESAFGLTESVERLRAATKRSAFSAMARETAVGTVKETRVSLQRVIPMMHNSFKPFFIGQFTESGGKVFLRGRFTMLRPVKLFMAVWLGLVALFSTGLAVAGIVSPKLGVAPFAAIVLPVLGLALVRSGQWFSRKDPAWLSEVIGTALYAPGFPRMADAPDRSPKRRLPIHLLAFAILFAVGGVAMIVQVGIAGIQRLRIDPSGLAITYLEGGSIDRWRAILLGIVMLACAYGIYRRYLLAWRSGFGLLAFAGLYQTAMLIMPQSSDPKVPTLPQAVMIAFTIGTWLVVAVWARWWYGQRVHFHG